MNKVELKDKELENEGSQSYNNNNYKIFMKVIWNFNHLSGRTEKMSIICKNDEINYGIFT